MRSSNPALHEKVFSGARAGSGQEAMTLEGTAAKSLALVLIVMVAGSYTWRMVMDAVAAGAAPPLGWVMGGFIGGLVLAIATVFRPQWSPVTAPLYAIAEGLALGGISAVYHLRYAGLPTQAVLLTLMVFVAMLVAYRFRLVRATENFRLGVVAATGGICLMYLVSWIVSMFGVSIGFLHDSSLLSIGISLVVVGVAALNLVLDFDFIEQGADRGAPKFFEWYGAFGLLVTLVWLYLELLRLLSKLAGRSRA
jgi:uncharacterized YccA/Bax inhibitor family protein